MTDSKAFGKMLNNLRSSKGITPEALAGKIGASKSKIAEWESGAKTPNRDYARRIVEALNLDSEQARKLLSLAGHYYAGTVITSNVYRPTGIVIDSRAAEESTTLREREIQRLKRQLEQTQHAVDEISCKLAAAPSSQTKEQAELLSVISKIKDLLAQVQVPTQPITAPVILPPPEDMEVRLVSSTSLQRMEEYRSEENKWYAVMGILLGAILGIFINVVTGGYMTAAAWILVIAFAGFAIFTGLTARRYQQRGNAVKAQILREQPATTSDSDSENTINSK